MDLEGERLRLREFASTDVPAYQRYHSDSRYLEFYAPEVAERGHAHRLVHLFMEEAQQKPRRNFTLAAIDRANDQLVGCCSLRSARQPDGRAEFGLEVAPDWWGRGIATEAAKIILEFGFTRLGLLEVIGEAISENHRVEKLVKKLGFSLLQHRSGADWMRAKGWQYADWCLTRAAWEGGAT